MDVGDLKVKISADVSDVQKAVQQAAQEGAAAAQSQIKATSAQLDALAVKFAKAQGGDPAGWRDMLQRSGMTADAAAAALGSGFQAAGAQAKNAAAAAKDIAEPTKAAAKAADDMQKGFSLGGASLLRASAALAGVGLGINVVAGVARLVHDVIADTVQNQLNWERSLKTISGLYGDVGSRIAAIASAQASTPGLLGTQQEFAQYALNASVLSKRFGVNPDQVNQLVTTGGRVAFTTGMTDQADRERLQAQILAAVQTGANLPSQYGVYTDPEAVARRLGLSGGQSLNAFTPQEVMQARAAIVNQGLSAFSDRAGANQRAALDAVTAASKAQQQVQATLQNGLEGLGQPGGTVGGQTDLAAQTNFPRLGTGHPMYSGSSPINAAPDDLQAALVRQQANGTIQGLAAIDAEQGVHRAAEEYVRALADSKKVQEDNDKALEQLAKSADAAGAKLLSFTGSLEDATSIAHAQLLAQAQGGVASLARSAVPTAGMTTTEINAIARNTVFQDVLQNYVATLAQDQTANPIKAYLEQQANMQGPGLEAQRDAAGRALGHVSKLTPIASAMGQLQTSGAGLDLEASQKEADLERITLTQRERYVQLMRDTVELRLEDNAQQQQTVRASMDLIRAQQGALPAQFRASDAGYQQNMAQALAKQRMARLLRGQDVSGLPSIDELIAMNVNGQLNEAENAPSLVAAQRNVELAGRPASEATLSQALTEGQVRIAELATDARNLRDLPLQTQQELELLAVNRDQLTVQQELRDYTLQLIQVMSSRPSGGSGSIDLGSLIFGQGGDIPAPQTLPGARRGPY